MVSKLPFDVVFKLTIFWLKTENNADLYIIKLPNLSSTRKCGNEPQDTLFSWFGPILFLPH